MFSFCVYIKILIQVLIFRAVVANTNVLVI